MFCFQIKSSASYQKVSFFGVIFFIVFLTIFLLANQGRSKNLKEVSQNFMEVFNIDDVTANDVIQRNKHRKEKK